MDPVIADRGSHLEVTTGASHLRGSGFIDLLVSVTLRFGIKPILVLCDDPGEQITLEDAYRLGIDIATRLPSTRVAVALRGRHTSEADRFIELVAANRGSDVRFFEDVTTARTWLSS